MSAAESTRVLLFTGKGGVGKTTVSAGTAALAARRGQRTLVMSTDAAHSLADAFGREIGGEPTEVAPSLWVQQVDAQRRFEQSWGEIQGYLLSVLDAVGVDAITAEELTVIPGAEEVLALLELRNQVRSRRWDVVVVDCAPTAETLRLLALPEALGWYMDRIFPVQHRIVRALRPVLTRAAGVPMPGDQVFGAIERLHSDLAEVRELLAGAHASVRLVLTPEKVVLAEARRSFTTLCLYGYRVDGVVANRVFPDGVGDEWREGWVRAQAEVLAEVDRSFESLPVWRSSYQSGEPVGVDALVDFAAEAYRTVPERPDPLSIAPGQEVVRFETEEAGATLVVRLPFATRTDVELARHGEELVITVGSYRRVLALPVAVARMKVAGAKVDAGALQVRFRAVPQHTDTGGDRHG